MNKIINHLPTKDLQALDAAHHMHPFTENAELAKKGVKIITAADGVMLTDSDGKQILDGMAGLWCVNIGYGRKDLFTNYHARHSTLKAKRRMQLDSIQNKADELPLAKSQ